MGKAKFTKEYLLKNLRDTIEKLGRIPKYQELKHYASYNVHFGSYSNALRQLGYDKPEGVCIKTKEENRKYLKEVENNLFKRINPKICPYCKKVLFTIDEQYYYLQKQDFQMIFGYKNIISVIEDEECLICSKKAFEFIFDSPKFPGNYPFFTNEEKRIIVRNKWKYNLIYKKGKRKLIHKLEN